MLDLPWNKVLRELWGNKLRTALVVISIAIGVLAVGTAFGSGAVLPRELRAGYAMSNPSDAVLITSPFDDNFVEAVRIIPEVRDAEGRRSVTVRLKTGPGDWRDLYLFAVPDFNNIRINKVEPESGAWPPAKGELLIERSALSLMNAQINDWVTIETPDARQLEMHFVGLAYDQSRQPAMIEGKVSGYITFETLEWLGQPRNYNELYITVAENASDQEHNRRVATLVSDKVERSGRLVLSTSVPKPGKHPLEEAVQGIVLLLGTLGLTSLLLSGFLVINTISALLAQQVRQIGIMKAIGGRTYQLAELYLGMALILGLLAVVIGAPLGILGAGGLSIFVASLINTDIANLSIPPSILAMEVLIGLLVPLVAALYPVLSGTRVTVHEATSNYGLDKGNFGSSPVDRLVERVHGLPSPLLISIRNTFRRKGRLALTLLTLTMGSTAFIAVTSLYASTLLSVEEVLRYWQYDVHFTLDHPYRIEQIEQEALLVPGVAQAEHWSISGASRVRTDGSEGENIWVMAVVPNTFSLRPKVLAGRWLLPGDENAVVISNKLLDAEPDVKIGDQIVLKIQGRKSSWHVVGNIHMMLTPGPMVYVNSTYFADVIGTPDRADGVYIMTTQKDAAFQSTVARNLEEHFKAAGIRVISKVPISDVRTGYTALFGSVVALLLLMALLIVIVGGLGLMGIMGLNVLERSREIGVMRAIGASRRVVLQVVLTESVIIGIVSWLLGCILAIPISRVLSDAVGMAIMQVPYIYAFSVWGALLWLLLIIIFSVIASYLPARRASRLTVREALAYE